MRDIHSAMYRVTRVTDPRVCPECSGAKEIEYDHYNHNPAPGASPWESYLDACQLCGGDGEIEVEPVTMEDLPC